MSLKFATTMAIVGSAIALLLGIMNMVVPFVPSLQEVIYQGPGIVVLQVLWVLVHVSYLLFFITLAEKQKKGA
jgi:hypothetical protein